MISRAHRTSGALVIVSIVAGILFSGAPAGAHDAGGPPASDYTTTVLGVRPPAPDLTARLGPDREQIELRATGAATVVVLGYRGEPYLRVGPRGAFENQSSPAVALNQSRDLTSRITRTRRIAAPRWVQISAAPVVRWHDHRAHWMGGTDPAVVRDDPDRAHVIDRWKIPIRIENRPASIHGTISWHPPPSPWPWLALAGFLAVLLVLGARSGLRRSVFTVALVVMIVGELVHLGAGWTASDPTTLGRIGENIASLAAVGVALVALVWLRRRDAWSAAPLLILAGLSIFVSGGLADLATLSHSILPTSLDTRASRLLVSVSLGLGLGLAMAGARLLWSAPPSARTPERPNCKAEAMPTIFSRIIAGELPGRFVWRDDTCVAFLSINPLRPGHTLVVPRAEVDHWVDLPADTNAHLMRVAHEIGGAQMAAFAPSRIGLIIAGMEVPHVHLHIVPIDAERDLSFSNADLDPDPSALDAAAERLRAALRDRGCNDVSA